jgi:hypothetical protein
MITWSNGTGAGIEQPGRISDSHGNFAAPAYRRDADRYDATTKYRACWRQWRTNQYFPLQHAIQHRFSQFTNARENVGWRASLSTTAAVLKYLITAYGLDDDDISGQQLMGKAMSVLHDHPILGKSDIEGITPDSRLHEQLERVRITPDTLSLDDMSKLWSSFQSAEYRLSTGYEVSAVLIESKRLARTPLPVLTRGKDDKGIVVQPNLIPPFPTITSIDLHLQQVSALPGDTVVLNGHHLNGTTVIVRFNHRDLPVPIDVPALANGTDNRIRAQIPNNPAAWAVGVYSVEAIIAKAGEQTRATNVLSLFIAPQVLTISPANPIATVIGKATITLTFNPEVRANQRASILLGDREILANDHPDQTGTLIFEIENAPVGTRHIRLRIDGVDSLLVDRNATPPSYDNAMKVVIT